jgi:hypothetical protein
MSHSINGQNLKLWINRTSVRQSVSYLLASIRGIWNSRHMPSARPITLWLNIFVVMLSARAYGQEAIRMSLASEQAAAAQNPTVGSNYYNVQAGPVYLQFQGEMGIEFNDNVNYTESDHRADVILRPVLNTDLLWPLTERNSFSFYSGLGYVYYLRTSTLDHPYVSPNSKVAFRIYAGDFVWELHDRFSAQDNVLQTPSLSGTGNYFQIENIAGVDATWDLYKLILSLGFDYDTVSVLSGPFTSFTHNSDLLKQRTTFLVNSTDRTGLELEGGLTAYDQSHLENNTEFAVGPFYETKFSPHLRARLCGGFAAHFFTPTSFSAIRDFDSYYFDLSLSHELNKWFSHWLSAGRRIEGGTPNASLYVHDYLYYQANFYAVKDMRFGLHVSFDHGDTEGGLDEVFDRYGAGIFLSRSLNHDLTANITYEFWRKNSDLSDYGYVQNRLIFDATYKF